MEIGRFLRGLSFGVAIGKTVPTDLLKIVN
jgi:hypothetical protein